MKVLLDENLPHKLRAYLAKHEVATVAYIGWGGVKNGELRPATELWNISRTEVGDCLALY